MYSPKKMEGSNLRRLSEIPEGGYKYHNTFLCDAELVILCTTCWRKTNLTSGKKMSDKKMNKIRFSNTWAHHLLRDYFASMCKKRGSSCLTIAKMRGLSSGPRYPGTPCQWCPPAHPRGPPQQRRRFQALGGEVLWSGRIGEK